MVNIVTPQGKPWWRCAEHGHHDWREGDGCPKCEIARLKAEIEATRMLNADLITENATLRTRYELAQAEAMAAREFLVLGTDPLGELVAVRGLTLDKHRAYTAARARNGEVE